MMNGLHSNAFWHGVRLGYAQGTMAGGVIGGMVLLFTDWRWAILLFGAGAIGVCAWTWERVSWEHPSHAQGQERRLTAEEFDEHFGDLPKDGEG